MTRLPLSRSPKLASLARLAVLAVLLPVLGCSTPPVDTSANATAERLYRDAKDDMDSGSFERAIKAMERVEGLAAGTLLAQQALLDMAYMQWRTDERTQALATVERFIKLNPSSPALDYAYFLRGSINYAEDLGVLGWLGGQDLSERDQRAARDAWQAFKQLVDRFPQSTYAPEARRRMAFIVDSLSRYEVHVARYYFRRGAYVAAANRAQQAVAEFQGAPAVEEALYLMMLSYDKLQLKELRDAAERVLKLNFPDSAYLKQGFAARDNKAWWRFWQ
jgi:outer membrane protein assembly factor BamD